MQAIELQEIEQCKYKVHYEATPEEIDSKKAEVIDQFRKAPIPGCRQGKANETTIRLYYAKQIDASLQRVLCEEAFHDTIFSKKLRAFGPPAFLSVNLVNKSFSCDFEMHTKPDFELTDYKGMEIPKPPRRYTNDEYVEKLLNDLRIRFGDAIPYSESDFVQETDNLIIDYECFYNGEKLDSLSAVGEMVTVGKNEILSFDSNVLGMSIGETREFCVILPQESLSSLAGKEVMFKLTLQMGSKNIPCSLDDELAKRVGLQTYQELRNQAASIAMGKVDATEKSDMNQAVCAQLINRHNFDVPMFMKLSEAQYLAQNAKLDWNTMCDTDKEQYLGMASKNVMLSLVLDKIRETEPDCQLSDNEVFDMIKGNLLNSQQAKNGQEVNDIIKKMNETGYLQILFQRIKDEHVLNFVVNNTKFVE